MGFHFANAIAMDGDHGEIIISVPGLFHRFCCSVAEAGYDE